MLKTGFCFQYGFELLLNEKDCQISSLPLQVGAGRRSFRKKWPEMLKTSFCFQYGFELLLNEKRLHIWQSSSESRGGSKVISEEMTGDAENKFLFSVRI